MKRIASGRPDKDLRETSTKLICRVSDIPGGEAFCYVEMGRNDIVNYPGNPVCALAHDGMTVLKARQDYDICVIAYIEEQEQPLQYVFDLSIKAFLFWSIIIRTLTA